MKKKTYTQPKVEAVVLMGSSLMNLRGSNTVNNFRNADAAIYIGDTDEPSTTTESSTKSFY